MWGAFNTGNTDNEVGWEFQEVMTILSGFIFVVREVLVVVKRGWRI